MATHCLSDECILPADYTCRAYQRGCQCPNLEPDPDIAGIGVVFSFVVVGTISLIIFLVCMFLSLINTTSLNPADRWLRELVTRFMSHRIEDKKKELWVTALTNVLVGLSDQQLITCLAILLIATIKMAYGEFSVYHFSICVDLAWFSLGVHTITLAVLSSRFRRRVKFPQRANTLGHQTDLKDNGRIREGPLPIMTGLRLLLMGFCGILMIFCLVIQGYEYWWDVFGCPVDCVRRDLGGRYGGISGAWSTAMIVMLLITLPAAMMNLTNRGVDFSKDLRFTYMRRLHDALKPNAQSRPTSAKLYDGLVAIPRCSWWWFNSILVSTLLNIIWFGIGINTLYVDRAHGHEIIRDQGTKNEELEWGFGQIVPLVFCVLPFIAAGEAFWGKFMSLDIPITR